jgi:hypothetical protein
LSDAAALLCQTFPFQDLDYQIYTPCFRLTFPFYHFSSLTREQRWTHTQRSIDDGAPAISSRPMLQDC